MMEGIESLSPKQREVMELVVKGLKTDAIAPSLGCGPETVKGPPLGDLPTSRRFWAG